MGFSPPPAPPRSGEGRNSLFPNLNLECTATQFIVSHPLGCGSGRETKTCSSPLPASGRGWGRGLRSLISLFLIVLLTVPLLFSARPESADGILPKSADGRSLNFDFETGDLRDWKVEGAAFADQPIEGDTVSPRRGDMASQHQGKFWIGGWERHRDKPTGTLTSVPFVVTHAWCSFLVGGGPYDNTCVELVSKETGKIISRTSGIAEENLLRVAVDLGAQQGKEIFIRLVDKQTGHWGHLNFDDFRFHAEKPDIPPRPAVREPGLVLPQDQFKSAGLTPEQSAAAMTVPEGFVVTLGAGEPDVRQPIAFAIDDRGRLWVLEAYCYPKRKPYDGPLLPEGEPGDRIVIFEDADGDGKLEKRTVFMEGLNLASGIELGFGGVWIGAAPYLMFIPADAKNDKPAGPPQILLDGWAYQDTHETLNTFTWGPDGWLYGCHGVFTYSNVGKPGTPPKDRIPINAGIWRYHPTRHIFEVFAHGTSNPWGLAFNEVGEMFVEACVIPHVYHIVPGGRYERQAGQHFNPHTYDDIKTIADHRHYLGANPHAGNNRSDSAGGGHAHCGLMCYQGGAWPDEYRGKLFMGNIHGRRINMDILKPKGSSYVASHGPDFLLANDANARFINMQYGPDGNVWLIDWYDQQACHDNKVQVWDRTNGRIYKISYRGTKPVTGLDLQKSTDDQLVEYLKHPNEWYASHARRILQERFPKGQVSSKREWLIGELAKLAFRGGPESVQLRSLWTLYCIGAWTPTAHMAFQHKSDPVRAWTARFLTDNKDNDVIKMALSADPSPIVRRSMLSTLLRFDTKMHEDRPNRLGLIMSLSQPDDLADPIIPHLLWYAAEPFGEINSDAALALADQSKVPLLQSMVRRIASTATPEALQLILDRLKQTDDAKKQREFVVGLSQALEGRRRLPMPAAWPAAFAKLSASSDADVRVRAEALAVTFGDPAAIARLRQVLADKQAAFGKRQAALVALLGALDADCVPVLHQLIAESRLAGAAIRGLALFDDAKTPETILAAYSTLGPNEKRDAVSTLAARVGYATQLIAAVKSKKIPVGDVPATVVRQLRGLRDSTIDAAVNDIWGVVSTESAADRAKEIAAWKKKLNARNQPAPDLSLGRAVYAKTCASCHVLFGEGGTVGPDITGSNRASLDYLLENILDPSAVIPKEYTATLIDTKRGRFVIGIIKSETPQAVTVALQNETITIPVNEISNRDTTDKSMMPDDQLKLLKDDEVRALIAYLQSPKQVPLPKGFDPAK
jgi:putative membrane-bound dehydrogenase-like protein